MTQPKYTAAQYALIQELCDVHGLQADQISFDGSELNPIFDYEAVCALSLKLTDIADIKSRMLEPTTEPFGSGQVRISNAECTVTLPDGRTRTCVDSAQLGETVAGRIYDTPRKADGLAQNRSVRRGIRSVGVDLYEAHRKFMDTGELAAGHTDHDPRLPNYREIHVLGTELGLIVDGDKTGYRRMMGEMFDGVTSSKELNDIQLRQFLVGLRAMAGAKRYNENQAA
jgi:hypothetical protein